MLKTYGIDIGPRNHIVPGLHLEHPVGIVIGIGVRIGKNVSTMGVMPGVKYHCLQCDGQDTTILGDVYLVTGCTTLPAITVGNDSIT